MRVAEGRRNCEDGNVLRPAVPEEHQQLALHAGNQFTLRLGSPDRVCHLNVAIGGRQSFGRVQSLDWWLTIVATHFCGFLSLFHHYGLGGCAAVSNALVRTRKVPVTDRRSSRNASSLNMPEH